MPFVTVDLVDNQLHTRIAPGAPDFIAIKNLVADVVRNQGGGGWDQKAGAWVCGLSQYGNLMMALQKYQPAITPAVAKWIAEMEALQQTVIDLPEYPDRKYLEHQVTGITFVLKNANAMLLDDQGLGKTFQAAVAMRRRHELGAAYKTLIICPSTVKSVWVKEIKGDPDKKWVGVAPHMAVQTLDTTKDKIDLNTEVLVINFELGRRLIDKLLEWAPDFVIIDEVHRMKNRTTKTFEALSQLNPKFRLSMSGTLVANRPEDVWAPINWTVPGYFPDYWGWVRSYCVTERRYGRLSIAGYRNQEDLKAKIKRISLRRTKAECLDLPERTFQVREIEMTSYQKALYEQCRLDLLAEISAEGYLVTPNALTRTLRLAQIASNPRLMGEQYEEVTTKYDEAMALVQDNENATIIWSCYRYDLFRMAEMLHDAGIPTSMVHGMMPMGERQASINRFMRGETKVFLATPASCREGLTLVEADSMVYLNRSFNAVDRLQSADRNYRVGQTRPCTVYDLVVPGTVDHLTYKRISGKAALNDWMQAQNTEQELAVKSEDLYEYLNKLNNPNKQEATA